MKKLTLLLGLIILPTFADYKPSFAYKVDPYFGHHVIVAEKSTHKLYLYAQDDQFLKLLETFPMATGLVPGDKRVQGDKKTPEGIYITEQFLGHQTLIKKYGDYGKMYGAGAFTLSYPNPFDRHLGKTGSGIWLHSTDDESRIDKQLDSKGCVVVNDSNLAKIAKYIDLDNTIFIIIDQMSYLTEANWNQNKSDLMALIHGWRDAWNNDSFKDYISHYSKHFTDRTRGNLANFAAYKKTIFRANLEQKVNFDHISIFAHKNHAVAIMRQDYKSKTINDIGRKTLHLIKNSRNQWKILKELWKPLKTHGDLNFKQPDEYVGLTQAE